MAMDFVESIDGAGLLADEDPSATRAGRGVARWPEQELTQESVAFVLGQSAPCAELLSVNQGVASARGDHGAGRANRLRPLLTTSSRGAAFLVGMKEKRRIFAAALARRLPGPQASLGGKLGR